MRAPIRVGVIGAGRMGRRRMHLAAEHEFTELVAVADPHHTATALADELGCDWRADAESVLTADDVDLVVVSAPNRLHLPMVTAALEAGKHVFCEKPLARNVVESLEIVRAEMASKTFVKVGANLRYFPNVSLAKVRLSAGDIGIPLFARGWIGHEGWNLNGSWFADDQLAGGGTFLDNGVHVFDVVRWLIGEVEAANGVVRTSLHPVAPIEDNGFGLFEFEGGVVAYIQASWTEWSGYMYLEVYGSEGFMRIDNRDGRSMLVVGSTSGDPETVDLTTEGPPSFAREWDAYVQSLLAGGAVEPGSYDGLRCVQMAWSVYEAARTGARQLLWNPEDAALADAYRRRAPAAIETRV